MRLVQARALRGSFWHLIYRVWWLRSASRVGESAPRFILACYLHGFVAAECVYCRRERSKVHFDLLFTMVLEVLGVICARLREG